MTAAMRWGLWALAAAAVVAMGVAELSRPLADPVTALPATAFLDAGEIQTATAYREPLRWVGVAGRILRAGVGALAVLWLWRRGADAVRSDTIPAARWRRCLAVGGAGAAVWVVSDLVRLPLAAWAWRRALDVGLSTQDLPDWLRDQAVTLIPYWLGVGVAVAALAWAVERLPRAWIPLAGLAGGGVGVILTLLSPLLFEPLLLDFTPLPQGSLREGIEQLVEATGEEVRTELLVGDASRRTTTSNAYVSGLGGTRRIVLYDTLLDDAPQEEVLAIIAHELAHDVNSDLERGTVMLLGVTVLLVAAVGWVLRGRLRTADGHVAPATGAVAVGIAIVLLVALAPVERWSSRRAESAADAGAIALIGDGDDYAAMMVGLARRNLADPQPPRWVVVLFSSHPPSGERIARARSGG